MVESEKVRVAIFECGCELEMRRGSMTVKYGLDCDDEGIGEAGFSLPSAFLSTAAHLVAQMLDRQYEEN